MSRTRSRLLAAMLIGTTPALASAQPFSVGDCMTTGAGLTAVPRNLGVRQQMCESAQRFEEFRAWSDQHLEDIRREQEMARLRQEAADAEDARAREVAEQQRQESLRRQQADDQRVIGQSVEADRAFRGLLDQQRQEAERDRQHRCGAGACGTTANEILRQIQQSKQQDQRR